MAKTNHGAKHHLRQDPVLAPLVDSIYLEPLDLTNDIYLRLLRAIVYQQLSGKAANTIYQRFISLFPEAYPHPDQLLLFQEDELRAAGLSRQKAHYIQNVARHFSEQELHRQDWSKVADEHIMEQLTAIKGVGNWTAQIILMFSLGRKDIFPKGDLAIQQSMQHLYQLSGTGKQLEKEMEKIAQAWRPYRTVACRYLWQWKDTAL
ncbi:DNA-3-methyladenine glycosylase [Lewinella sp. LCG006]|uniref:DNA-3-methyladenine glycosylase family protein n=1 Tax=Lewinella sp. LCG006 TaxID=3231911 RepID=UPI0034600043